MSINEMANAAAARRPDMAPLNTTPKGLRQIAKAATTSPNSAAAGQDSGQIETALNVLFGYIPVEVLTLYVAAKAAIEQPEGVTPGEWRAFWIFLAATPVVVWLVYAAKVQAAKKPLPFAFGAWPVWEMFAATLAYFAWALALPKTPFSEYPWYSAAVSGFVVLVASTLLGLLAPIFQRPLKIKS
jgi:hypothetical protein